MRQLVVIGILVGVVVAVGGWLLLRGTTVELSFDPDWPETVRGIGESVEPVAGPPKGKPTKGDRARAAERARWKAYYYAQLRFAEQLGGLRIDAATTIDDAKLVNQDLEAAFNAVVKAAAEVPSEGVVEDLGDAVRARVVVEAPAERVASLRETVARWLSSGRLVVKREPGAGRQLSTAAADRGSESAEVKAAGAAPRSSSPARSEAEPPARPVRRAQPSPSYSGVVVTLDDGAGFVGAAPDFYDGAGTLLGSSLDLPASRRTAGLVIASAVEDALVRDWAGTEPLMLAGTVSRGNVVLDRVCSEPEVRFFAESLEAGRVVLVIGGEER